MEAAPVEAIPEDTGWQYEPKWDGFRCLAFREGEQLQLQSKSGQPLERYFPEMVAALSALKAKCFVLDGELAIPVAGRFSFDDLLQRIHPAQSRVLKLSHSHPAVYVVFDLLVNDKGQSLIESTLRDRRLALEEFARRYLPQNDQILLSPATANLREARHWFEDLGGDLDGVVAKRLDADYRSGDRTGMRKIKRLRTADCVVGGFRYAENSVVVGSLLLGLYNDQGLLDHVGFCSSFKASERAELLKTLRPLVGGPGFTGRAPGGPSRWSTKRSVEWQPLRPELVVEVSYDHFTGGRFRHGTRLIRWRPDKVAAQCRMDQVAASTNHALALLRAA